MCVAIMLNFCFNRHNLQRLPPGAREDIRDRELHLLLSVILVSNCLTYVVIMNKIYIFFILGDITSEPGSRDTEAHHRTLSVDEAAKGTYNKFRLYSVACILKLKCCFSVNSGNSPRDIQPFSESWEM